MLHTAHSGFVDLALELGVIPTVFWLLALWIFLTFTRNSADPLSTAVIAYAMLHNCLETSFLHGLHFVWVLMVLGMMNILYTHAHKPDFRRGFGSNPAVSQPTIPVDGPASGSANGLDPRVRGGAGPIPGVARDS